MTFLKEEDRRFRLQLKKKKKNETIWNQREPIMVILTLCASMPVRRVFVSWSLMMINGLPYSSKANDPVAVMTDQMVIGMLQDFKAITSMTRLNVFFRWISTFTEYGCSRSRFVRDLANSRYHKQSIPSNRSGQRYYYK